LYWPFTPDDSRIMTLLLLACSPTVIPRPKDWSSSHIHIPGYLFLETTDTYHPPAELDDFLAAGDPPVCVTFGSMINRDAERIYQSVFEALAKTKNRAIILSGWSDMKNLSLPRNILVMESVPHDWLLPRCKTVIHHGGAGTTAAGLRSGIPNIVVSFAADQPFWGARVHAIDAGPQSISVKTLTAEKLVAALVEADEDALRNSAQAIGRKIRAEDGVGGSVKFIETYAAKWHESSQSEYFKV
jgi:UDP:flavonoid glycosyltransferase YjiC (YdhE family)